MKSRRGSIIDWFFIIVILFATVIMIFVMQLIVSNAAINKVFTDNNVQEYTEGGKNALLNMDSLFMFVIIGLSIFVLVSSALVYNHPAMFFFSLFFLVIAVVFAAIMANSFYDMSTDTYFNEFRATYPKIVFLMENMPMYIAFMGIMALVAGFVGYRRL